MTVVYSPQKAPDYAKHRENVTAAEAVANFKKGDAINMANYQNAHIQVLPTPASGADPTVTVYWWSEAMAKFVQENPALTKVGVGANVPFEFTVPCGGRRMLVLVTTLAAGTVDAIMVSGFELEITG